jgi:sirohydrochlorin cobaltochelatase
MNTPTQTLIFICNNKKLKGKCCFNDATPDIYNYIRAKLNQNRDMIKQRSSIKVVKTSCLGQCGFGPNIYISPDNIWYRYSCVHDIDEIIDTHFMQQRVASRLINKGIHNEPV